jgi:hypothetical protein
LLDVARLIALSLAAVTCVWSLKNLLILYREKLGRGARKVPSHLVGELNDSEKVSHTKTEAHVEWKEVPENLSCEAEAQLLV